MSFFLRFKEGVSVFVWETRARLIARETSRPASASGRGIRITAARRRPVESVDLLYALFEPDSRIGLVRAPLGKILSAL